MSLLVSNQSLDLPEVDIDVHVDGRSVLNDTFSVGPQGMPQHAWKELKLRLASGTHHIVSESRRGAARLEAAIELPGVRSLMVAFWTDRAAGAPRGKFTIDPSARGGATM